MSQAQLLEEGVAAFEQAALVGRGWTQALDAMARGVGATGTTLPLTNADGAPLNVLCTASVHDAVQDYLRGRAPPNSRERRVAFRPRDGFHLDQDDYSDDEIRRDAFYQEFLRPNGCGWHAAALLACDEDGELSISLKRSHATGPFSENDRHALEQILPRLRHAALIGRLLARTPSPANNDHITLRLSWDGRAMPELAAAEQLAAWGITVRYGRLVAPFPGDCERLDAAVREATRRGGGHSATIVRTRDQLRIMFRMSPIGDAARQVFGGAAAVAVAREIKRRAEPDRALEPSLRAFGLTPAETRVALLLAAGWPLTAIATRLDVATGTARNQVKLVLAKTGVARQAEFVALAGSLLR